MGASLKMLEPESGLCYVFFCTSMSVSLSTLFTKLNAKDIDQGSDTTTCISNCNNQLCGIAQTYSNYCFPHTKYRCSNWKCHSATLCIVLQYCNGCVFTLTSNTNIFIGITVMYTQTTMTTVSKLNFIS